MSITGDDICKRIVERRDGLESWLKENAPECFDEQKHAIEGTSERVYWHYGYLVALRDVIRNLGLDKVN